ncbi:dynein axonemal assembly factor 11 isoform X1 [Rhopalosiphum padi]|uniref:dynein axonemal assembly factor 11 isoform X1 n=1 Tax=Rhopalosiphum padi TaxID=40932 RepID=UPI00298D7ACE|nr:dynein axonemal assembly factor 11 isoform X1 [Rhopalosiphum padi]XP_060840294.1 dynein axonemal assembly factor 11 isoform X1 [Rhopalosiphum padi]
MANITIELIRKRSEHNEGEIGTLEEISLHQEDITKIENLQNWCKDLKILLLQSNLIFKIENLNKLKKLEYLNLALNCIEIIENLDRCESLNKLDLTMNFIGKLDSIESLKYNTHLRTLYLTGNPCTDYDGYREYVIGTLPQIDILDGIDVTSFDKLVAKQQLPNITCKIIAQQKTYENFRIKQKESSKSLNITEETMETHEKNYEESDEDFWNQPSENTPECRVEMALHSRRAQRKQDEAKKTSKEEPWIPKLFAEDGRPYNLNQAKVSYKMENEHNKYVLTVHVYKFMDTSELDVDVQPTYVRVTVRKKILQLALDEEVRVDESNAKRLIGSKLLEITMPKVKQIICPVKKQCVTDKDFHNENKSKLTDEVFDSQKQVEFWNITNSPASVKKTGDNNLKDFVDNSEVPPLE